MSRSASMIDVLSRLRNKVSREIEGSRISRDHLSRRFVENCDCEQRLSLYRKKKADQYDCGGENNATPRAITVTARPLLKITN